MIPQIQIGAREVGDGRPCFVIAEAGSNHNGSLEQARCLIDAAADAGADAVKFQIFRAERLYPRSAGLSDYLGVQKSIFDVIAELEVPFGWIPALAEHCRARQVVFLASAFDEESVDALDPYVPAFKVASYEMTHYPLLRHTAAKGKPVLVSTGTATLDEVAEMVDVFRATGNPGLVLMQCTAAYPAPLESLNVRVVPALKAAFGVPVGLSDHSRDAVIGPLAAVAVGANSVEKHFTLGNRLPGPDHRFGLEPDELRRMVEAVRETERALGDGRKSVHPVEEELRHFARRSVFTRRAGGRRGDVHGREHRRAPVREAGCRRPSGAVPRDSRQACDPRSRSRRGDPDRGLCVAVAARFDCAMPRRPTAGASGSSGTSRRPVPRPSTAGRFPTTSTSSGTWHGLAAHGRGSWWPRSPMGGRSATRASTWTMPRPRSACASTRVAAGRGSVPP